MQRIKSWWEARKNWFVVKQAPLCGYQIVSAHRSTKKALKAAGLDSFRTSSELQVMDLHELEAVNEAQETKWWEEFLSTPPSHRENNQWL